ncbi:uroporphyrinogen-III C-methyltransferase [Leptospira sp. 96542]|nr:uroporphyrinogen-III C-methyltransferase [Leptospira sp. 96542]
MSSNKTESGFVWFVGGGPGPVDLLTLRAHNVLKQAEVILYDALLDPGFLEVFPLGATILYVGKRSGEHYRTQTEINSLLVQFAKAKKRVIRLKGGDPSIFGRLTEEIQALEKENISYELVPGVSSVTAGAASLGVSLTVRGLSRQIIILDGHSILEDNKSWLGMENFTGTIAILMGSNHTAELAKKLIEKGITPNTPMALLEGVGSPNETYTLSSVGNVKTEGFVKKTKGPGILYVGEALRCLETKLLKNQTSQYES